MPRSFPSTAARSIPRSTARLRPLAVLLAAVLLGLVLPAPSSGASVPVSEPDRVTCEGYPEPRVFLEGQDWWQPTLSGSEDFGHVHAGACFPRTHLPDGTPNVVTGRVRLDVRVVMHQNPGVLSHVRVHLTDRSANHHVARVDVGERCVVDGPRWDSSMHACVWWVPVEFDTRRANHDGFQEVRVAASVRQVETEDAMFSSTGWQLYLGNGEPVRHYRANSDGTPRDFTEGRGWYEGAHYTNARLGSRIPYVVSGVWEPDVRLAAGSGGVAVQRSFAAVDPDFHRGNEGKVLLDRAGAYSGRLRIDTTELSDGPHRLYLRADAPCDGTVDNDCGLRPDGSSLNVSTNSGAVAITFIVDNGVGEAPEPPPGDGAVDHDHDHDHDHGDADTTPVDETTPEDHPGPVVRRRVVPVAADAYVSSARSTTNFGGAPTLRVREWNKERNASLLSFEVPRIDGHLSSAVLRLWVVDAGNRGGSVRTVADTWHEGSVTWRTAPPWSADAVAELGAADAGSWVEVDVSDVVTGAGRLDLAIVGSHTREVTYAARESGRGPELVLASTG